NLGKQNMGTRLGDEHIDQREVMTNGLTSLSQRFKSFEMFYGIGDSTKVFAELGYKYRVNDSLRINKVQKVSRSNTYYFKSKLIQNANTDLGVFINYRTLKSVDVDVKNEQSLNSRFIFSQQLFNQMLQWNTVFETNS